MNEKYRPVRDIQPPPSAGPAIRQIGPKPLKAVLAVLAALVLIVSALGYFTVGRLGSEVASAGNLSLGGGKGTKDAADGATDILLVGTDSRTDAQGNPLSREELDRLHAGVDDGEENTDTMMVIRVPNDGSSATAVSIPRDTYIHDEDFGNMKINGVYAAHKTERKDELIEQGMTNDKLIEERSMDAGREGLLQAVTDLTGVEVDNYAEIGLFGFVLLTDAVGGVDVCLNAPVDDEFSGADFPAGEQTLNGAEALAFVRQRHGLPRGDLDRIVRQQAFMASLVNKVLEAGTLTNPGKLSDMSNAVERSVVIDANWDIMSFATQLANLAGGNVTFTTIPVTSIDGTGDYGESIVTVDVNQVHGFMDELLNQEEPAETEEPEETGEPEAPEGADSEGETGGEPAAPAIADLDVHVLNAGQTSGLAGSVGAHLEENGYTVVEVSNAQPGIYWQSQVVAADAQDPQAQALAETLGGVPVTANPNLDASTLIVVTHDDYAGPMGEATDTGAPTSTEAPVGTPGTDFGDAEVAPEIDAGGDGPRCVN
ncbi:LCP family protein [Corynebacterium halotolerans]|uniref:LytR family transcriptional regulator n=1 Tax=Corynebacterium halotolerans YIM 70093 = DSM 44683 TaxID=1121362 RepID=M1NW62_9CORY|nr:LCP family protein [Corynebacterium halotolerans]AGF71740.1 hypothetical protein A605_03645 [Corynebacterium halotolerans YIM 70093 = DSM 44683]